MVRRDSQAPRRTVLVVDDELAVRAALLSELGDVFEVVTAASAEEACEILDRRKDIAAVVSDMMMRGPIDGYELLEEVRAALPRCARVLLSSSAHGEWYVCNGTAQRFVQKPWEPGAVLSALS